MRAKSFENQIKSKFENKRGDLFKVTLFFEERAFQARLSRWWSKQALNSKQETRGEKRILWSGAQEG